MLVKVILYTHFKVIELRTVTVCFWFDVENQMCVKCIGMFFSICTNCLCKFRLSKAGSTEEASKTLNIIEKKLNYMFG